MSEDIVFSIRGKLTAKSSTLDLELTSYGGAKFSIPFQQVAVALASNPVALGTFVGELGQAVDGKAYAGGLSESGFALIRAVSELGKVARAWRGEGRR